MEFSNIEACLKNKYDSFTQIFNNWYIVVKEEDGVYMGIVDTHNNTILPLEKGSIFANESMIFINRKKSFVWDSNGKYITEPEEGIFYKPSCGIHKENKCWKTFYSKEIIVYTIRGDDKYNLHLYVPGKHLSKDSICFRNIERLNDQLFMFYNGEISNWSYKFFGIINEFGNVILPCKYQIISEQNEIYYFIENINYDGSRYSDTAIDKNGHILVNSDTCTDLQPVEGGYVIFHQKGKVGLYDPSFNIAIPAKYNELRFVKHNVLECNRVYHVDYEDNPLIVENDEFIKLPSDYCYAYCVGDNRYRVSKRNLPEGSARCGLIDIENNILMPFIHDIVYSEYLFGKKFIIFEKEGKSGIADMNGKILLDNLYDGIETIIYADQNQIPSYTRIWNIDKENHPLYGLLSSDFSEILPPIHQVMRPVKDDIVVFMFNHIWGFYSFVDNSTRILHGYTLMRDFSEGFCSVCQGGVFNWYEKDEDEEFYIHERFASVTKGRWGVVDTNGCQVVPCIYDMILPFHDGMAVVRKDSKRGLIDTKGCSVVPLEYDDIEYTYGVYIIKKEGLVGCVTSDRVIIDSKYVDIYPIDNGNLFAVKIERAWGVIDKQNEIIIPMNYHHIEYNYDRTYTCYLGELPEYDIIDSKGKIISTVRIEEDKPEEEYVFDPFDSFEDDEIESMDQNDFDHLVDLS